MKQIEIQVEYMVIGSETITSSIEKLNQQLEHLNVGDIVILSSVERSANEQKYFDEAKFFIVSSDFKDAKNLIDLDKTPNGFYSIPLKISQHLETHFNGDYVQDYMKKYQKLFQMFANTFTSIELESISRLVPDNTQFKSKLADSNNNELRVFYFFKNPSIDESNEFDGDYFVWLNKPDEENSMFSLTCDRFEQLELNQSCNLEGVDEQDRDLEMEEYAAKFKSIYETQFREYLRKHKVHEPLSVTSLPMNKYNKDTIDQDLMNSTTLTFYFEALECDEEGNINAVVASSFDRTQNYYFMPFLCENYGPFYMTTLYASLYNVGRKDSQESMFFLDLPVALYNLLDSDD